jgi:hypothetical protein
MLRVMMAAVLLTVGVAAAMSARGSDSLPAQAVWKDLGGTAGSILERRTEDWGQPGSGYLSLEERGRTLNHLLDRAVSTLARSDAVDTRKRIAELRERAAGHARHTAELRATLAALPEERCAGAGANANFLTRQVACAFATSRDDQARRIAESRRAEAEANAEADRLQSSFRDELARLGIELTPEQVDGLLRMATAEDVVAGQAVYDNLRRINEELQKATVAADESVEVARRYYGFYTVLLEVAMHLHERFLDKVRNEHMPRLAAIEEDARTARATAVGLHGRERTGALEVQLTANIKALDLTLKAAGLYRQTLNDQVKAMTEAWQRVARQHEVAVNTWRTVRASADMLAMMGETGRAFEVLMKLDLPAPRPFENQDLQREFGRLTQRLSNGT